MEGRSEHRREMRHRDRSVLEDPVVLARAVGSGNRRTGGSSGPRRCARLVGKSSSNHCRRCFGCWSANEMGSEMWGKAEAAERGCPPPTGGGRRHRKLERQREAYLLTRLRRKRRTQEAPVGLPGRRVEKGCRHHRPRPGRDLVCPGCWRGTSGSAAAHDFLPTFARYLRRAAGLVGLRRAERASAEPRLA